MERFDGTGIESMLRELRSTPQPEFVAELDTRAVAGFPRASGGNRKLLGSIAARMRALPPRRLALATSGIALAAIVVATAIVASDEARRQSLSGTAQPAHRLQFSESAAGRQASAANAAKALDSASATELSQSVLPTRNRSVERSASIALLADPEDVADDSAQIFAAVHDANGIVLRSNTTQGPAGRAGATFDLLIPSARLGDALAAISAIDEVGSRHDATVDITAPTVAVGERLHDSRARIDSLLAQLATAETESEREALEAELRGERRQAAALEAQLAHLHRRTRYSHLSVRIETGDSPASSGGAWGFDDALGSAGHVLTVAAGVTLVGLAVLAPIAILALLAWLAHRTWLRIRREHALSRRV